MPTLYIDNEPYTFEDEGRNLLEVCLSLGFDIPYFCWHPALGTAGACRQCAVKLFTDAHDTRGRLVMSCETLAQDGMRLSIDDAEAVAFRRSVAEWLMVNHPHDCPVCDEGGECHLQDMTLLAGQVYRRARFPKRTYRNQDLGPLVNQEMNRCIQCYRCTRFYNDFAGGRDFGVFGWHDRLYFGRAADGVLESPFSGNLVEICPTGVFTDKTQGRHYVRKWDLQTAPSLCVHCGAGCNTIPGERYGVLRRQRTRYHGEVNGYFLCDRGRYGYEFVNGPQRVRAPQVRTPEGLTPVAPDDAMARLAEVLRGGAAIGIGSPRASLEANFALRALVGAERCFAGVAAPQHRLLQQIVDILRRGPARTPSQQEIARADAVFILGEDLHNTAPMLALAVRQAAFRAPREAARAALQLPPFQDYPTRLAIQEDRGPLFIAAPWATGLDDDATAAYRAAPDDLARFGHAVAHRLDPAAPAVDDLPDDLARLARQVADALTAAHRPVIISGGSCGSMAVVQAAANAAGALHAVNPQGALSFVVPACNSLGLALLGGGSLDDALAALDAGQAETVIVLENDLSQHDGAAAEAIFTRAREVVVLDCVETATTARATVLLPAAAFAESTGTLVNHEGRAQRFFQVFPPADGIRASWRWLGDLHAAGGRATPWQDYDALAAALAELPGLRAVAEVAPGADFRIVGQKIARQSHRASGRTAVTAAVTVHEPPPPADADTPFVFSMEGHHGEAPASLIPQYWAPGWNSIQALNKFQQEVGGPLRGGDPGRRLLEPAAARAPYFPAVPEAFTPRAGQWLLLPAWHIFGSEPLSLLAPGIAALAPAPYLLLHAEDAGAQGWREGDRLLLQSDGHAQLAGRACALPLRLAGWVPRGVAVVPDGLPGLRGLALPGWGTIRREEAGA